MFRRVTQGAVNVIQGDLPLNAESVEQVAALLAECAAGGPPYTVVDLEKVPLIDSAGLELLLDYGDEFQQRGGALKLAAPSNLCREILMVTGVGERLEVFGDSLAAVGSFVQ